MKNRERHSELKVKRGDVALRQNRLRLDRLRIAGLSKETAPPLKADGQSVFDGYSQINSTSSLPSGNMTRASIDGSRPKLTREFLDYVFEKPPDSNLNEKENIRYLKMVKQASKKQRRKQDEELEKTRQSAAGPRFAHSNHFNSKGAAILNQLKQDAAVEAGLRRAAQRSTRHCIHLQNSYFKIEIPFNVDFQAPLSLSKVASSKATGGPE